MDVEQLKIDMTNLAREAYMRQVLGALLGAMVVLGPGQTTWAGDEADPYLWLEEVRGEKPLEWVQAHNEATLAVLKAQPGFEEV